MVVYFFLLEAILLSASAFLAIAFLNKRGEGVLALLSDDSDMKIAPESFTAVLNEEEESSEAESYLAHKENGNLEKAHNLGRNIFEVIKNQNDDHNFENKRFMDVELKTCLYFIACLELSEDCPDEIISDSAKAVLRDCLKEELPEVYAATNNTTIASLLRLSTMELLNRDISFGKAFAEICSFEGDKTYIDFGVDFFKKYSPLMRKLILEANFK